MAHEYRRARWDDLSQEEVKVLEGHVGPAWLPQWFCNLAAEYFRRGFRIEGQMRHDLGYIIGGNAEDRYACDLTLLAMMRRDSRRQGSAFARRLANYVSDLFFLAVRMLGLLSFSWRDRPLDIDELRVLLEEKRQALENGQENRLKNLTVPLALIILLLTLLGSAAALLLQEGMVRVRKAMMQNRPVPTDRFQESEA